MYSIDQMTDLIDRQLGQYRIISQIGEGGMGTVYQALHVPLDRTVALKVMHAELSRDSTFVRRFLQEARAAARLDHANIVPIYDTGQADGTYYIAMKFLEGQTLDQVVAETGPMGLERATGIFTQLASALDYAHRRAVIHRDIKPTNVMVGEGDQVTLMDFGIAKALESQAMLTQVGMSMGTPEYMSPEQIQAQEVDARSDVYSLGIVLYQTLTGDLPFTATTPLAVALQHIQAEPPSILERRPDLPPEIEDVLRQALAKSPAERYTGAGELAAALDRLRAPIVEQRAR